MPLKPQPPKRLDFNSIPVEKRERIPAAKEFENILVASKAPERIRQVGIAMLNREQSELDLMLRYQKARRIVLTKALEEGKITVKKFNEELNSIEKRVKSKLERFASIRQKLDFLLRGRMRTARELALNDPMYTFIRGHKAFSTEVQRRLVKKGTQTITIVDVDKLKLINDEVGMREGGTKILRAYAEAAKEIADKYGGIASHYGGDEFTFHFYLPANEVASIMGEFQQVAKQKIMTDGRFSKLADAIRAKKILGTATAGVLQVDFPLHQRKSSVCEVMTVNARYNIYSSVMEAVTKITKKGEGPRGIVAIIKDGAKEPE